jgi:hypothetical protein
MSQRLQVERRQLEERLRELGDDQARERDVVVRAIAGIDDAQRLIAVAPLQSPPPLRRAS